MPSLRKRFFRFLSPVVLGVALVVLAACGNMNTAPQTTFVAQGNGAREILNLFMPVFWVAVGVFVIVEGLLVWSVIRYRRRPEDGIPLQIHGNTPIEIAWTIIPAIIVVGIATLTFRTQGVLVQDGANPLRITVVGHQWWWEFQYPEYNFVTANELHIPDNRDIEFALQSQDVIHSFWFPRLSGKTDVVPGHTNILRFRADQVAQSTLIRGECAEFCGGTHAQMGMFAVVDGPAQFDTWVRQQQQQALVPAGIAQAAASPGAAVGATAEPQAQATAAAAAAGATATENESEPDIAATVEPTANASPAAQPGGQATTPQGQGYQLFQSKGCVACHAITGYPGAVSQTGPNLTHVGSRQHIVAGWLENTPDNMRRWLRDPNEVKPGNVMGSVIKLGTLNNEEIDALTAYLESLK